MPDGLCPTLPAVGGTGTITCNDGSSLGAGVQCGTFTVVLQVNSGTPSGTNITDTATATATNVVPGLTSNTASATVLVASAISADMAIMKTATPNPGHGRNSAHLHVERDQQRPGLRDQRSTCRTTLPSIGHISFLHFNAGTCSEAGGIVTCQLGTMANAGTATDHYSDASSAAGHYLEYGDGHGGSDRSGPSNNTSTTEL